LYFPSLTLRLKELGTFETPETISPADTIPQYIWFVSGLLIQCETKKRELLKNPTKIEKIQEKKFIDRN
jgi:hypothetical protein